MDKQPTSKHEARSAQTRALFIQTAQKLYAQRSIDSVSLNEITVAAGQRNRNALQYHFGNRDGLLQAIIDTHAETVHQLRQAYLQQASNSPWTAAEAAARVLVMPLADYIQSNPAGIHYVKILSQLAAINSRIIDPTHSSKLNFRDDKNLNALFGKALHHLPRPEAQRRMFLVVSITFHSIADILRAATTSSDQSVLRDRQAMFDQIVSAIASLIAAPARE